MLASGLLLAGWGLLHLANASPPTPMLETKAQPGMAVACGFGLKLSDVAESVELSARDGRVLFHREHSGGPFIGMIQLDTVDPAVFVKVRWQDAVREGDRFVKLTLEPAGKPTLTHYFEAPGTIEDVWERLGE